MGCLSLGLVMLEMADFEFGVFHALKDLQVTMIWKQP